MNIIWLSGIIFGLSIIGIIIINVTDSWWEVEGLYTLCWVLAVAAGLVFIGCGIVSLDEYQRSDMYAQKYEMYVNTIQHQINNDYYETEFVDNRSELYEKALEWNMKVFHAQWVRENSKWFKSLYGPYWDEVKMIAFPEDNPSS